MLLRAWSIFLGICTSLLSAAALAAPLSFSVDGVITRSDGTALEEAGVQFTIDIKSPTLANSCLLYRESFTVDMTGSKGYFSLAIGKGTNLASGSYSLSSVFASNLMFTGLAGCSSGSTYTPTSTDDREIVISFTDSFGPQTFSSQHIEAVPFAVQAKSAENIEGFDSKHLLKVNPAVDFTANPSNPLSQIQYDEFWKLILGTSTTYMTPSAVGGLSLAGDVSGFIGSNLSVDKIKGYAIAATVPTSGQVLTYTGGVWTPAAPSVTGVTSVSASAPLSSSGGLTPTISILQANTTQDGYLSQTDWNAFNNKLSSITSANITSALGYTPISNSAGFVQDGNSFGVDAIIGTNDPKNLSFETNSSTKMTISSAGSVGIGTTSPSANLKLQVDGTIASSPNIISSGNTVDLSLSNIHYLKSIGGSTIALTNMASGGSYTLVIYETTQRTYTFSGCTNSYFSPANGQTYQYSTFSILAVVDGGNTNCFINWVTGFN